MKYLICGDFTSTERNDDLFRKKDVKTLFGDVVDLFKQADRVFVNVECALTDSDEKIKKFGPHIKTPIEAAEVLKSAGVTDCGLSNNHIFDYGPEGATDTINALKEAGLNVTGFGNNSKDARNNLSFITDEGKTVTVIAVCDREYTYATEDRMGARAYDEYDTMLDISLAKKNSDFVIVIYHGGKEFSQYPSPRLRKSCQSMVKFGADAVLCQHTHCIGSYETFEGGHILYGQGNFHFAWDRPDDGWNEGLMVLLDICDECKISFIPCIREGEGIRLAKPNESKIIMNDFNYRNEELMDNRWKHGWRKVCEAHRHIYEAAIKNAFAEENIIAKEQFRHYLDCEAHCDIFRELFPTWNQTEKYEVH